MKGWNTSFKPMLAKAIEGVKKGVNNKTSNISYSVITVVTDGHARYPTDAIASLKAMIVNGVDVTLHWIIISEE